jgi:hypothetical protein
VLVTSSVIVIDVPPVQLVVRQHPQPAHSGGRCRCHPKGRNEVEEPRSGLTEGGSESRTTIGEVTDAREAAHA